MGLPQTKPIYTIAEYVDMEERSEFQHEFHNGEILAMSGTSPVHSRINTNLVAKVAVLLVGRPCSNYDSHLRIRVPALKLYFHPDMTIFCDLLDHDPEDPTGYSITNPRVIFEVLSPSTEAYDRGIKFKSYQRLTSLKEYVMVWQESARVETYDRQADGSWTYRSFDGPMLNLSSIDIDIAFADIYAGVHFSKADDTNPQPTEGGSPA